jgi:hypothetical protein
LLLDFDNIFGSLLTLDRAAALRLAEDPISLLHGLVAMDPTRDLLVRRAYLNPAGWVADAELGNASGRLYLQRFRPNLVRAGFEVLDCPALTSMQKNAADIRMVLDIVDLVEHTTRFDEFIIASGDADFTPVLQRLRSHDRRTTVVTAGPIALAYEAVADSLIDDATLIELVIPSTPPDTEGAHGAPPVPGPHVAATTSAGPLDRCQDAATLVREVIAASAEPVLLAELGNRLHDRFGSVLIRDTRWFGHGSLGAFVTALGDPVRCQEGWAWDSTHHEAPAVDPASSDIDAPAFVVRLTRLADMPRLRTNQWPILFEVLAEYSASHEFNLTECTSWARDRMAERSDPVGRQPIGFVVRGALVGGTSLNSDPPPEPEQLRNSFERAILSRAEAVGVEVLDEDRDVLTRWLTGAGGDGVAEPAPPAPVSTGPVGH